MESLNIGRTQTKLRRVLEKVGTRMEDGDDDHDGNEDEDNEEDEEEEQEEHDEDD